MQQQLLAGIDSAPEDEHFGDSQDESRKGTFSANMIGAIFLEDDNKKAAAIQRDASLVEIEQLGESQDDFMDTYVAINLDVRVRESQLKQRVGDDHPILVDDAAEAENAYQMAQQPPQPLSSRYQSRLSIQSPHLSRPLSKED